MPCMGNWLGPLQHLSPLTRCLLQGFEWYDTGTSTLLSNVTFEGYRRGSPYTDDPTNWWFQQAPSAFRMLSASDQFKPGG